MVEKNWPQATKNSVEKVAKRVAELEKKSHIAAINVRDLNNRLDTISASASASALVQAVKGIADALRGKPGLNENQAKEIFDGLLAHVNKLKGVGKN